MATSIGQYAPVFLPGETPSLTEKPGRPVSKVAKSRTLPKQPHMQRCKMFFACGSSAPVRVEGEGGTAVGTLVAPSVQDTDCLCCRSCGPIRVFFRVSCSWQSEGLFGQSFSVALPSLALRGLPCLASFCVIWHVWHLKGHPGWGPTLYFGA